MDPVDKVDDVAHRMRAGTVAQITRSSGQWAFVDVGFAQKTRSTAILVDDEDPHSCTFSELRVELVKLATRSTSPLNLVIEAPLSAAFTSAGNPAGRVMEKSAAGHRYWYAGMGCQITVASAYLLRSIIDSKAVRSVRLFEAFVSFKQRTKRTGDSHALDVRAMRDVVWNSAREQGSVIPPDSLLGPAASRIESALAVFGFELGVPPVIVASAA